MLAGVKSVHTYSISLSFFKNIIEILKVHFTSLKKVNKVCLFVFLFLKIEFCTIFHLKSIQGVLPMRAQKPIIAVRQVKSLLRNKYMF